MAQLKTEAVILKSEVFFEKDKRLLIFSADLGKIYVLAKGAASRRATYTGRLEVSNHVKMVLYSSRSFYYLQHCDLVESFPKIREDFNKLQLAFYCMDILIKATVYQQDNQRLFELISKLLSALDGCETGSIKSLQSEFQRAFLVIEGLLKREDPAPSFERFSREFEEYCSQLVISPRYI